MAEAPLRRSDDGDVVYILKDGAWEVAARWMRGGWYVHLSGTRDEWDVRSTNRAAFDDVMTFAQAAAKLRADRAKQRKR